MTGFGSEGHRELFKQGGRRAGRCSRRPRVGWGVKAGERG